MIISIHIPKTAGTTFFELLSNAYGKDLVRDYEDRPASFDFKLKKFTLNPFNAFNRQVYYYLLPKNMLKYIT